MFDFIDRVIATYAHDSQLAACDATALVRRQRQDELDSLCWDICLHYSRHDSLPTTWLALCNVVGNALTGTNACHGHVMTWQVDYKMFYHARRVALIMSPRFVFYCIDGSEIWVFHGQDDLAVWWSQHHDHCRLLGYNCAHLGQALREFNFPYMLEQDILDWHAHCSKLNQA